MTIGQRIREARHERGFSMGALAKATGLSKGFLSQLESGASQPSLSSLQRLTNALGVSLSSVLDELPAPQAKEEVGGVQVIRASRVAPAATDLSSLQMMPGNGSFIALRGSERLLGQPATVAVGDVFCLVVDGGLTIEMGNNSVILHAGDLAIFNPVAGYRIQCTSSEARAFLFVPRPGQMPQVDRAVETDRSPQLSSANKGPFRLVEMRAARIRARRAG